jgi:cullin-associated NEDD8-dissociated protein 1
MQAAQQAIVMTPEFNTLGSPLPKSEERSVNQADDVPASTKPYKALVMLFLHGGADTFNMLIPQECPLYNEYVTVRTDLALEPRELDKIETQGQACRFFGVHKSLNFVKKLYDDGEAAFISNVGNLVEPLTLGQYRSRQKRRCFGTFSHSDQQNGAQTLKCQDFGTGARGAGGRIADALSGGTHAYRTTSFSLAGSSIWGKGVHTQRSILGGNGALRLNEYEAWRPVMFNITAQVHGNVYSDAYAKSLRENVDSTENLARVIEATKLATTYPTDSGLERELQQVAKLIRAQAARGAERDFFFVGTGGWDMHSNMKANLANKLNQHNTALKSFVKEMKAQGVWNNVLLMTESEFGRTLNSNGGGSDHAYAGNHFVMSGSLKGGRIFNRFHASLAEGNDHDLGRGRLIPDYPWESVMVPIAKWLGVAADQLSDAFPNFANFNSSHIIDQSELFTSN